MTRNPASDHFHLTYFDPPAGLEKHVLALFHFVWDEADINDRHPGALSQIFLTPHGSGSIQLRGNSYPLDGPAHMFSGFETASPMQIKGPWHAFGASLSPLGWAALARVPANKHMSKLAPAREFLGQEAEHFAAALNEQYRQGEVSGEAACRALGEWIAPRMGPVPRDHELLIEATLAWLGSSLHPDVGALYDRLDYSRRQAERLVARYFGLSPAALARKMRAVRAANLLAQPQLTDEGEAEIAAAFYDQPHMIREIRHYCGYTPTRLGGAKEPLFQMMLRMKNLERLMPCGMVGAPE